MRSVLQEDPSHMLHEANSKGASVTCKLLRTVSEYVPGATSTAGFDASAAALTPAAKLRNTPDDDARQRAVGVRERGGGGV